jgi:hypothetical protein
LISPQTNTLRRLAFHLAVLVLFTSLIDLFLNRLFFRAGPEVLSHIDFDFSIFAILGRISFTLEQFALFLILASAAVVLALARERVPRLFGLLVVPQLFSAGLLYFGLPSAAEWSLSTILVGVTWAEILGLIWFRISQGPFASGTSRAASLGFLLSLAMAFSLPLYYRISIILGTVSGQALPFALEAYTAGIYLIMVASAMSFIYAIAVMGPGFRLKSWGFIISLALPTFLVAPILYGLMESFFMGQIFSLVVAMSTDITLSYEQLRLLIFFWWFLLAAVLVLLFKGRASGNAFLVQSAIGLVLILSTSFLFNYPPYLLLGTVGVLLLAYPLVGKSPEDVGVTTS